MIRMTIELVPFGNEEASTKIGQLVLANTGRVGGGKYEYHAVYADDSTGLYNKGAIYHNRADGIWVLLQKILEEKNSDKDLHIFTRLADRLNYE